MSDTEANDCGYELSFDYGDSNSIKRDVDLFEKFYGTTFHDDAFQRICERFKKQNTRMGMAGVALALTFVIPMIIAPQSIFALLILIMGLAPLGFGLYYLRRNAHAAQYCEKNFKKMLDGEFATSRSEARRIFIAYFDEDEVRIVYKKAAMPSMTRRKSYRDIEAVYETDELFFIKGLTWFSKFQMDDDLVLQVRRILTQKCAHAYIDTITVIEADDAPVFGSGSKQTMIPIMANE